MAKRPAPKRDRNPDALHGLLPLVMDADTGAVRFRRAGDDLPPIREVGELPDARLEVVAFGDGRALEAWHAAVREFAGNHVAVSVPEIDRPRFALLTRFDMEPHPGATLREAVPLRFPAGRVEAASLEDATRFSTDDAERSHRETSAARAIEHDWATDLTRLRRLQTVDVYVSGRDGAGPTIVTKGPDRSDSWSLSRDPDGRVVATTNGLLLRTTAAAMDADLRASLDERMRKAGIGRNGLSFRMALPALDEAAVSRLGEAGRAVREALADVDRVSSLRNVARSLKEDRDLLPVLRAAAFGMPVVVCPWHGRDGAMVVPRRGLVRVGQFVVRRALDTGCLEPFWSRSHERGRDVALGLSELGRSVLHGSVEEVATTLGSRREPVGLDAPTDDRITLAEAFVPDEAALREVEGMLGTLRADAEGKAGAAALAIRIADRLVEGILEIDANGAPSP